ncbi:unnamed protein product (macronuclear) [Paramecium tetraurelia]|uniref:Phospholipid/glycerol acyltransferase domain-containing protein n=1 Tax=Paramecium tetraurelia TaxID=5888 RepID=A0DYX3_PARTE|nr:uncharacterized protein GSPATT00003208001 [Paramecium tetraurelia]CAK88240.1 unnamed protein product [Paramecium tetraurelia]|eukprot:XP_001455637.1 hypothetical protein (macronuclear) [Paramecium tetraurelia strain d4-2]
MEKFRAYADPHTGINLFVPAFVNQKLSPLILLIHIILGSLLVLIRIPLLVILISLLTILNTLKIGTLNSLIGKLMLLTCGFYNVENQIPIQDKGGQLILANHSSPIDWIYFLAQSSPNFATFVECGEEIRYQILSLNQVIKNLFSITIAQTGTGSQLNEVILQNKPTLLFFEGCQTNQLGVLSPPKQMISELQNLGLPINIYILTYPDRSIFTPINTTRNGLWHFILLLTNVWNNLKVVSQEFQSSKDYQKLITNIYECEGFKIINQKYSVQTEFLSYFWRTSKGNYVKQD